MRERKAESMDESETVKRELQAKDDVPSSGSLPALPASSIPVTVPLPDPATRRWYEPEIGVWPVVASVEQRRERMRRRTPAPDWVKAMILERIPEVGETAAMAESSYGRRDLFRWAAADPAFRAALDEAKTALAHRLASDSVDLLDQGTADDVADPKRASAHVSLLQGRSRSRQWLAARLLPDVYGEKIEHRGQITQAVIMLPPLEPLPGATVMARISPESEPPRITDGAVIEPEPDAGD